MKRTIIIVIISTIAVFCLQGLWIKSMYKVYTHQTMERIETAMEISIGKEISYRKKEQPFNDPKNPKVFYKPAEMMTPEEKDSLKGDTLSLKELKEKNIGSNMYDVILQISQDRLIEKKRYIQPHTLDSLFQAELQKEKIETDYCILIYNQDTTVVGQTGTLDATSAEASSTRLFPIGTKGMQFVQVKTDIGLSAFLRQMLYILMASAIMVAVILNSVAYLMVVIRRKERLFRQREANVNGTVHDLKSPLNGIVTLLGFLRNKQTDPTTQTLMDGTIRQAKHLIGDIEALLVTARRDRQQIHLQKKETDLVQLVEKAKESLSANYTGKGHRILVDSEQTTMKLEADALYITNVIRNLLENALKYSDEGVIIQVRIRQNEAHTYLEVEDNGWGIERKYHRKIFQQFFQVPNDKEVRRRGYGVGLAYSYYIMEAHGGTIRVKSEPGKGSTFTCVFPNL